MKKFFLGLIIGAAAASGIFYIILKQNENEEKENLKSLLTSFKEAKSTQMNIDEALNDPKASLVLSNSLTIVVAPNDEYYYFSGNDCSKMVKTVLSDIKDILLTEKKQVPADQLMIIIKKMPEATFKNSIDLLDMIGNAGIAPGHFAQIDITEREKNCLKYYK